MSESRKGRKGPISGKKRVYNDDGTYKYITVCN